MKTKLLITTFALMALYSGLHPAEEPSKILEWKSLSNVRQDDPHYTKVAACGLFLGGLSTWGINKLLDSSPKVAFGTTVTVAALCGSAGYALSCMIIDEVRTGTNLRITSYNKFTNIITSSGLKYFPYNSSFHLSDNKSCYYHGAFLDHLNHVTRNILYRWSLGQKNVEELKSIRESLDVVDEATKSLNYESYPIKYDSETHTFHRIPKD